MFEQVRVPRPPLPFSLLTSESQLFQRLEHESELRAEEEQHMSQLDKVLLSEAADRVPSPVSTLRCEVSPVPPDQLEPP